jgi:hypothetical protein
MSHKVTKGIYSATVPDLTDVADIPADLTQLASDLLTNMVTLDDSIQSGNASVVFTGAATASVNVVYPRAYAATPVVMATARNATTWASVTASSPTGFTMNLTRINPSSNTYQAYWLAIPLG